MHAYYMPKMTEEQEQRINEAHSSMVVTPRPDQLKDREPGLAADDGLAVDQAGANRQRATAARYPADTRVTEL